MIGWIGFMFATAFIQDMQSWPESAHIWIYSEPICLRQTGRARHDYIVSMEIVQGYYQGDRSYAL